MYDSHRAALGIKFADGLTTLDLRGAANVRRLTRGYDDNAAWAPDGRHIAFVRKRLGGCTFALMVVDLDTGRARQITPQFRKFLGVDPSYDFDGLGHPDWSARGEIAFTRFPRSSTGGQVWAVRPDGSHLRRLASGKNDTSLAWSPDGATLAIARQDGTRRALVLHSVRSGRDRPLRALAGSVDNARWSPDGRRLVVAVYRDALVMINRQGTRVHKIASLRWDDLGLFAWVRAPGQ
jgi:Tol biopolymer transport system component